MGWKRVPESRGFERERALAKRFGICSGDRKEPYIWLLDLRKREGT